MKTGLPLPEEGVGQGSPSHPPPPQGVPRQAPTDCHTDTKASLPLLPISSNTSPIFSPKAGQMLHTWRCTFGEQSILQRGAGFSSGHQQITSPLGKMLPAQLQVGAGCTQALFTGLTSVVGQSLLQGLSLACPLPCLARGCVYVCAPGQCATGCNNYKSVRRSSLKIPLSMVLGTSVGASHGGACAFHPGQWDDGEGLEEAPQSHSKEKLEEVHTAGPPFPAPSLASFISMGSQQKADPNPPSTSVLPHTQAKSMLHTSNPMICYLQGQGPGWKPCLPIHPSSTKDHRAVRSLLQWGTWWDSSAQHPTPQDGAL